jgi:hypothetical protein
MPGFEIGHMYRSCADGHSSLVFVNKDGRLFWGFITEMDKTYAEKNIPRRASSQSDAHIQKYPEFEVMCGTKLSELWKNVDRSSFAVLEEGVMQNWTFGRFVCVGDSIHKSTINVSRVFTYKDSVLTSNKAGQGGNMAIESVAALANCIVKMTTDCSPSQSQIEEAFQSYERSRKQRAKRYKDLSGGLTRSETQVSLGRKLSRRWLISLYMDYVASKFNPIILTIQ